MKDNWTKAFQEKLGDFELDLPEQAAAGRNSARIVPLLLAGAAAAALLLMVLLRMPEQSQPGPSRLIAEAEPAIEASLPVQILPLAPLARRVHPAATAQKAAVPEQTGSAEPVAKEEMATTENVPASAPETEKTVSAKAVNDTWTEDWPEDKTRRSTRISYRVHFDPSLLRRHTTVEKTFSKLDYFGLYSGGAMGNPASAGEISHEILKEELRCDLPVKLGVSVQIGWPGRFSVGSGIDYSFHRSRIGSSSSSELEYRMHYLGLPVKGIFTIVDAKRLDWYAAAGGELEWMVAGRIHARQAGMQGTVSSIDLHPFIFSLTASTGLELKFSEHVGLYAEPGIAWHTLTTDKLPDYYHDHPVSFDLHLGVRFDLSVR